MPSSARRTGKDEEAEQQELPEGEDADVRDELGEHHREPHPVCQRPDQGSVEQHAHRRPGDEPQRLGDPRPRRAPEGEAAVAEERHRAPHRDAEHRPARARGVKPADRREQDDHVDRGGHRAHEEARDRPCAQGTSAAGERHRRAVN